MGKVFSWIINKMFNTDHLDEYIIMSPGANCPSCKKGKIKQIIYDSFLSSRSEYECQNCFKKFPYYVFVGEGVE